jgi:hypothetical protein
MHAMDTGKCRYEFELTLTVSTGSSLIRERRGLGFSSKKMYLRGESRFRLVE